jgi:hypothetical protein
MALNTAGLPCYCTHTLTNPALQNNTYPLTHPPTHPLPPESPNLTLGILKPQLVEAMTPAMASTDRLAWARGLSTLQA